MLLWRQGFIFSATQCTLNGNSGQLENCSGIVPVLLGKISEIYNRTTRLLGVSPWIFIQTSTKYREIFLFCTNVLRRNWENFEERVYFYHNVSVNIKCKFFEAGNHRNNHWKQRSYELARNKYYFIHKLPLIK